MIVKIQQSLFTTSGESTMLIYNRGRSVYAILPLDPDVKRVLGDRPKGYFKAQRRSDGKLVIGARVSNQGW